MSKILSALHLSGCQVKLPRLRSIVQTKKNMLLSAQTHCSGGITPRPGNGSNRSFVSNAKFPQATSQQGLENGETALGHFILVSLY